MAATWADNDTAMTFNSPRSLSMKTRANTNGVSGKLTRPSCTMTRNIVLTAYFGTLRYDQVSTAAQIDVQDIMTCRPNSVLNLNVTASSALSDTLASAGRTSLGYSLFWKSDNTVINLNYAVDLSIKAKLIAQGILSDGTFTASTVIYTDYF